MSSDERPAARSRPRLRALAFACLGLAGLCFVAGFALFMSSLERSERQPTGRADGIVVLTGGAQRIEDAIELLRQGFASRLLITGVNERTSRETIKRLSPGQRDLVECCVDLDYRARNTQDNAAEIGRWARERGFGSLIVVTSNYHLPRTLTELDQVLPDVVKLPHAVVPTDRPWADLSRARVFLSEYVKLLAVSVRTRLAGWLNPRGATRGA